MIGGGRSQHRWTGGGCSCGSSYNVSVVPRVQSTVRVEASPEEVWEILIDVDRWPDWVAFTDEVTYVSEGPFGEGTVYRERSGPGPLKSESEWRVTEFDPPRRTVHRGDIGILQPILTLELDPANGYTRIHQTIDYELLPDFRPLGWLLERLFVHWLMQRSLNWTIRNLKRAVKEDH